MRTTVFRHLLRLAMPFYDREKAGVVVSRMTSDIDSLQELVQLGLLQFVSSVLLIVIKLEQSCSSCGSHSEGICRIAPSRLGGRKDGSGGGEDGECGRDKPSGENLGGTCSKCGSGIP